MGAPVIRSDQVTSGHALQIRLRGGQIAVTCPCLLTRVRHPEAGIPLWQRADPVPRPPSSWRREVIEARPVFPAAEAKAVWAAWHEREGIVL